MSLAFSPLRREKDSLSDVDMMGRIMLEKNGKTLDFFPGEVSTDRITAIQVLFYAKLSAISFIYCILKNIFPFYLTMYRKRT